MKIGLFFFVPIIILTLVCAAFPFIIHDFLLLYGSSRSVGSIQNSQTLKKKTKLCTISVEQFPLISSVFSYHEVFT